MATSTVHTAPVAPRRPGRDPAPAPAAADGLRDLTAFVGHHAEATVVATTRGLHRAIADRVFRWVPGSAPVRAVHHAISDVVYTGVTLGLRGLTRAGTGAVGLATRSRAPELRWLDRDPRHRRAAAIVHGVVGDRFADHHPSLDRPMVIAVAGRPLPPTRDALERAFPAPSSRVAVFLHGLTQDESCWDRDRRTVLPDVVAGLGWSPVRLRYGTGRAIGANGAELDALLETLVRRWPAPLRELALIGHSMGGLVIRSAVRRAAGDGGRRWPTHVRHTVSLGTPHLGSWLERAANAGSRTLRRLPEGAVVADVLDTRARGIKDLRHGALSDACWGPGVLQATGPAGIDGRVAAPAALDPLLEGAVHHLVAGRLTRDPGHPVARALGDALVTARSAHGDDGRRRLHGGRIELLEVPTGHLRLVADPAVAAHLRHWLG